MKRRLNKKGFLLGEETIKIIIAVVCIVFLVALAAGIYNNLSKNKDLNYAKASLDNLMTQINLKNTAVEIYNPSEWFISSFPQKDSNGNELLPKTCSSVGWESCICIYKLSVKGILSAWKPYPADYSADQEGKCAESDLSVVGTIYPTNIVINGISPSLSGIYISNPPLNLSIDYSAKTIKSSDGKTEFHTQGHNG